MYTPQLLHAYDTSESSLPIEHWVECVATKLPQFQLPSDIYAAIPLDIQMTGSLSNGSVQLCVSPSSDSAWYKGLIAVLEKMTNQKGIGVRNYLGTPIQDMSPKQLTCASECDIYRLSDGKTVRLASVVPPPLHMMTDKVHQMKGWWNENRASLSNAIAEQLKGKNMAEIAKATNDSGLVQQTIAKYMSEHLPHGMSFEEFMQTYSGNSNRASLEGISGQVLNAVRASLVANEKQVRDFHATEGTESSLWKKTDNTPAVGRRIDEFTMYKDIVEDAVFHPLVGREIIQSIMYGSVATQQQQQQSKGIGKKVVPVSVSNRSVPNRPIGAAATSSIDYYTKIHYPIHGKMPGHYLDNLNAPKTQYRGTNIQVRNRRFLTWEA